MRSDELYHHGIKGMRWGVRKQRDTVNKPRTKAEEREIQRKRQLRIALAKGAGVGAVVGGIPAAAGYGISRAYLNKKIAEAYIPPVSATGRAASTALMTVMSPKEMAKHINAGRRILGR